MPFTTTADPSSPRPQPTLKIVGSTTFQLTSGFYYHRTGAAAPIHIPPNAAGTTTDLASVPQLLWGFLASYGRQTLPAIMHDHLCDEAERLKPPADYAARRAADDLFRQALRDEGVDGARAATFWAGVVFGRYLHYRRAWFYWLFLLAGLCSAAAYAALAMLVLAGLHGWPASAALLVGALLVASAWRRDRVWQVLLIGTYVGVPVLLILAVDLIIEGWTRFVPWLVLFLASKVQLAAAPGPPPPWGPTRFRLR